MDRNRHSRPGQRMTRNALADRGARPSKAAAFGVLLVVVALATLAADLIGGGSALAHRALGLSVQASEPATVVRTLAEPPTEPVAVPQVPADAEDAQPIATF